MLLWLKGKEGEGRREEKVFLRVSANRAGSRSPQIVVDHTRRIF
jgi:hypothetical protein